jgi:hypothetical protein
LSRISRHLRANVLGYVAVGIALGGSGGYALAASNTKMITACADKHTGVLHLGRGGRCKRGQTRVAWNQAGDPGPTGPAGAPAVKAWATVAASGQEVAGQGLTVQHASTGNYLVTVTVPGCGLDPNSAPVVSISNAYPPNGQAAGTYPVSWVGNAAGVEQFRVFTGLINGSFSPADEDFNVQEACS